MNKDALRKLYESILPLMGLEIGSDDFISTFSLDKEGEKHMIQMMVNSLPVIFPTDSVLREGKWEDRVAFHPLSESVTRGVSPVLLSSKTAARFKIQQAIFFIGAALINVTKDSRDGTIKNLPANLVEVLGKLPKTVDAKSLAFFSKVIAADNDKDQTVVKICIKRNGSILGTDYKRTTSIYFPIYEQIVKAIENKESEFWGVTAARKTDLNLIKEVLEIILPDIDDENRCCAGTFQGIAPYLDCFVQALVKVQDSLNNAMDLLDKYIAGNVRLALHASTDFIEEEIVYRELRNVIPPLRFNEGEITEEEQKERETDTRRHTPTRAEKSAEIPDFNAKGTNAIKRAAEPTVSTGGRRYRDNTLTEEERRDPASAERRHSSRYDEDDDRDDRRSRDRDRDGYRDRYRGRDSERGRDSDRGRGRSRDRDDYDDRDRGRGIRGRGRDRDDYDDRDERGSRSLRATSWADRQRSTSERGGRSRR